MDHMGGKSLRDRHPRYGIEGQIDRVTSIEK
jgi:hypothetical protein